MKNNFKKLVIKILSMSLAGVSLFGAINSAEAMGKKKGLGNGNFTKCPKKQNNFNNPVAEVRVIIGEVPMIYVNTVYQDMSSQTELFASSWCDWNSRLNRAVTYAARQVAGFPDAKFVVIMNGCESPLVRPGTCVKYSSGLMAQLEFNGTTITYYNTTHMRKRRIPYHSMIAASSGFIQMANMNNAVELSPADLKVLENFDRLMEEKKRREIRAEEIAREAEEQRRQEEFAKLEAEERMEEQKRREAKVLAKEAKKRNGAGSKEASSSGSSSSCASSEEETKASLTEEEFLTMCSKKGMKSYFEFIENHPHLKDKVSEKAKYVLDNYGEGVADITKLKDGRWETRLNDEHRLYFVFEEGKLRFCQVGEHTPVKKRM